jgi:hypothetical protein
VRVVRVHQPRRETGRLLRGRHPAGGGCQAGQVLCADLVEHVDAIGNSGDTLASSMPAAAKVVATIEMPTSHHVVG